MSTYTPIASVTLSSAQSSVTFSGIPQTYTDLVLVGNGYNATGTGLPCRMRFNSDTGSNYSITNLVGDGTTATSLRASNQAQAWLGYSVGWDNNSSEPTLFIANIQNYSNTATYKTCLVRNNQPTGDYPGTEAIVNLWRSTSAVTSIEIYLNSGTFASGSTFNLYGVANASITNVAKATGGDSVYTDGTYWYHIFRSSGTFTPTQALTADYLVVAGGGGGGNSYGAGGGAGGLRSTVGATGGGGSLESALSLTSGTSYTVTVGAGGANNVAGSNSVFSSITSTGGGVGGAGSSAGGSGGSGGGAGGNNGTTGGTGTANQGYAGGSGASSGGGGGGGAGGVGGNASSNTGGNGGIGVTTSISGTSTTYAGGGGGYGQTTRGTGGSSIGGNGGQVSPSLASTNGATNTGSGGGGEPSGAGGSGIVIVRYAA